MEYHIRVMRVVAIITCFLQVSTCAFFGHEVRQRAMRLDPRAGKQTIVDITHTLPGGQLKKFVVFVHETTSEGAAPKMALQVWRPLMLASGTGLQAILLYSKEVEIATQGRQEFEAEPAFMSMPGDVIGFTCLQSNCPISYDWLEDHNGTLTKPVRNNQAPARGTSIMFSMFAFPAVFSFGVELPTEADTMSTTTTRRTTLPTQSTPTTPQGQVYKGNEIRSRSTYLLSGARKAWLDVDWRLPSGRLNSFHVYIHDTPEVTKVNPMLYLQIWREVNVATMEYELVFNKRVDFDKGAGAYTIPVENYFMLQAGDHVGWTNTRETGSVSYDLVSTMHNTSFASIPNNMIPEPGKILRFSALMFPSEFSIGVSIQLGQSTLTSTETMIYTSSALMDSTSFKEASTQKPRYSTVKNTISTEPYGSTAPTQLSHTLLSASSILIALILSML